MSRADPRSVLELGMHCGYSSVRILRLLSPAGKLLTVEQDSETADKGEEIILVAGFKHPQVHVHVYYVLTAPPRPPGYLSGLKKLWGSTGIIQ